ncbi:MFS transporter [Angustibacter sp. McL0619]|uniref:MFS transporter n=1 Tax=Angustibacter sp. McL0619 TaxID=3415676 RepID=UPI003CF26DC1
MSTTTIEREAPARGSLRPMVALLTAFGISLVGTRLSMIAVPLFVLQTTGSPTRTGLVAMAEMLPYVLAQGLSGPVTDRVGPRRMSITSDVVSVAVVGLIPVLHQAGLLHFATLLALVAVAGAVRGPGDSAKYVLAPAVAKAAGQPNERVLGLEDGISRAASVIGPLLAAVLVTAVGAATAIALDAATFAIAAVVFLVALRPSEARPAKGTDGEPGPDAGDDESYLVRLRAGARFVWSDGLLRSIVAMVAVTNLLDAALSGVLIAVWAQHRGGGAGLMGAAAAALSTGAVIGAFTAAVIGHRMPRRVAFAVGFFVIGAPRFAVLGFDVPLVVVFVVLFVGGLGCGVINPILGAVEMERIPEHMRARVMSLMTSLAWSLIPFGGLVGGLLATRLGIGPALLVCGVVYFVATTLPALRPEWARMNRSAPVVAPVLEHVPNAVSPEMADHGVTFDAPAR